MKEEKEKERIKKKEINRKRERRGGVRRQRQKRNEVPDFESTWPPKKKEYGIRIIPGREKGNERRRWTKSVRRKEKKLRRRQKQETRKGEGKEINKQMKERK